jgi:accessory gene regulator B
VAVKIERFVSGIISSLVARGSLVEDERDIYEYGLNIVFLFALNLLVTITLGLVFSTAAELALFYVVLNTHRSFSGGYHAKSFWACTVSSALIIFAALCGIKYLPNAILTAAAIFLTVFSLAVTFKYAPIASENRPLSETETRKFRRCARLFTASAAMVSVALICAGLNLYAFCVALGNGVSSSALLLSAVLNPGNICDKEKTAMKNRKFSALLGILTRKTAEFTASTACVSLFYQPKMPANISKRLRKS